MVKTPDELGEPKAPATLFEGSQDNKAKGKHYEEKVLNLWFEKHPKIPKGNIMNNEKRKREILESIIGGYKKDWYGKRPIRLDIKKRKDDLVYGWKKYGTDKHGYSQEEEARKELEILQESDIKFKKAA